MRSAVACLCLWMCLAQAAWGEGQPPVPSGEIPTDVSGVYHCEGDTYKGTVIIRKAGETYNLLWTLGNETHVGVGIRTGNLLASSWAAGFDTPGIVVYTVEPGRRLVGTYTAYPGGGQLKKEVLTYVSPVE